MPDKITDSYYTISKETSHEIKIKGSRFIALGFPIEDDRDALSILDLVRKKEYSATHHCFAYTVGLDKNQFKYSDDGEPSGTAGKPIYQVITGRKLKNVLSIVVRYYGGTKLGTGGLTRAYSSATSEMIDTANIIEKLICDHIEFSVPFNLYDRLMRIISVGNYSILNREFSESVFMELEVRKSKTDALILQLTELCGGKIKIEKN